MPEVIIIDEMGTEQEAAAARTIAERGVQLIATAHGNTLNNLVLNPTLSDLVGGIQSSHRWATMRPAAVALRRACWSGSPLPPFEVVVEIQAWDRVRRVHDNVAGGGGRHAQGVPHSPRK